MTAPALEVSPRKVRTTAAAAATTPALEQLAVDKIDVGENVRIQPGELEDLVASIKEHGVLQPVRAIGPGKNGRYRLVWGQRRLLASREAGLVTIPAIVEASADVDAPGAKRSIEQLVENLQRADLNPIDEAKALKDVLAADPELTQEQLAQRLGRSAPWLSNSLRLLELAPKVQELVVDGKLSQSHAKAIAGLSSHKNQVDVAEQAVKYDYSAKQVESNVKYRKQSDAGEPERKEQIRKKSERFAKQVIKLAEEAGLPAGTVIQANGGYDTDRGQIAAALKAAGFKANDGYSYGYKPEQFGKLCDCTSYRFDSYPKPHLERYCSKDAHVKAYQANEEATKEQRKKELRDKAKRLEKVLEIGLAGIDATTARLTIAGIFGSNLTYQLGNKGDPWPKLEAIAAADLPRELAELIASRLVPSDNWDRTDDSKGLAATINKLAAAPAKKAAAS